MKVEDRKISECNVFELITAVRDAHAKSTIETGKMLLHFEDRIKALEEKDKSDGADNG